MARPSGSEKKGDPSLHRNTEETNKLWHRKTNSHPHREPSQEMSMYDPDNRTRGIQVSE
jgi:hypothetical protein